MDLKKYIEAGKIGKEAREYGAELIKENVSYYEVAEKVEKYIIESGAFPAFPVNLSRNNIAAHYTPLKGDNMYFRHGDVIKLDLGAHIDGYISDTAVTVEVGSNRWENLIESTREALNNAIKTLRPCITVSEIGRVIEDTIKSYGYNPVYNLTGHGLAKYDLHHRISIPNYDDRDATKIEPPMAFAIEPFATDGKGYVKNGKGGNIYMFIRTENLEGFYLDIFKKFRTLPFAARWCSDNPYYISSLEKGVKIGILHHFPILKEKKKFMVAQTEHTIVMTGDELIVTTR